MLSDEERVFLNSISNKIEKYKIPTTLEEVVEQMQGDFRETKYNDNTVEIIDVDAERFLIKKSPIYFARKYGIISVPGIGYLPFDLYYVQEKTLQEFINHKFNIILKTRQIGYSTLTAIYSLWKILDEDRLETVDVISISERKAKGFKEKIEETLKNLPLFLLPKIRDRKTGELRYLNSLGELPRANMTELRMGNGSVIKCETASENAGRSDSISLLIIDEAAFFRTETLIDKIWASAFPTLLKTKGDAIILSTPNSVSGAGGWYYKRWLDSVNKINNFNSIEINWWEIPDEDKGNIQWLNDLVVKDYFHNEELKRIGNDKARYEELNWRQNKWLASQRSELGEVTFRQEILHDFVVSGDNVLSAERLAKIKNRLKNPILKDKIGNDSIIGVWVWEHPIPKRRYIISVDTSRGTGDDLSAIEVFDPITYTQVAEYKGLVSTKRLGQIVKIIAKHYNNAYVIIECNGIGESVFNEVYKHDTNPYDNVYKTFTSRKGNKVITGWETTNAIRKLITDELINWLSDDNLFSRINLYSERLYQELTTWIWTDRGPDHSKEMNDDVIMATCLALYCRNKSNNNGEIIIECTNDEYSYHSEDFEEEVLKNQYRIDEKIELSNEESEDFTPKDPFMKKFGIDGDNYRWLIR